METRRKLIRATVDVMAQKGPDATTIQDITETADVGFGSFYNYFKSKDEIRFAAMEELLDRFGSEIDQARESHSRSGRGFRVVHADRGQNPGPPSRMG